MFRWLNGSLQTVNTNSSHGKQLFENVFNFVSGTAGCSRSSQDTVSSCIPAVTVPLRRTDWTNTASPIKMTPGQVHAECGILKETQPGDQEAGRGTAGHQQSVWRWSGYMESLQMLKNCLLKGQFLLPNTHLRNRLILKTYYPGPFP